jgi:Calcineurin-like phosphoesterase
VVLNYLRQALDVPPGQSSARSRYRRISSFLGRTLPASLAGYVHQRIGPRHAFPDYSHGADRGIYPLSGDGAEVRVSIAGDWASGTDEAAAVATRIAAFEPHFTIHLGDAYYVGDESEVRSTFLGERCSDYVPTLWPRGSVGTFALNGNHEMYSRGRAYFDVLLPQLGLAAGPPQRASFFCLENAHWRIIALDTAYNSVRWPLLEELPFWPFAPGNDLNRAQLEWLAGLLRAGRDQRGLLVLTHHPPYSRFERTHTKPARQLRQLINVPVLWFFGHEHRLAVYGRYRRGGGIEAWGRNIGHGGMPVELHSQVTDPELKLLFTDSRRYANDEGLEVGYNGHANLTFAGATLAIEYCDLTGDIVYRERWSVMDGTLRPLAMAGAPD